MTKKLIIWWWIIWLAVAALFFCGSAMGETDMALLYSSSYARTSWDGGPEGTMVRGDHVWKVSFWVKTDSIPLFWELEPMAKITYDEGKYNFSSLHTPTQTLRFRTASGYIGVNKPLDWEWVDNIYLVGGVAYVFDMGLDMVEANGTVHGGTPTQITPAINLGLNKIFPLYGPFKAIVEFDIIYYPTAIGFDRCREIKRDQLNPWVGLGIVW